MLAPRIVYFATWFLIPDVMSFVLLLLFGGATLYGKVSGKNWIKTFDKPTVVNW